MTREEQGKLRELKKALPGILKDEIRKYKLKKKDYMIWLEKDEILFDCFISVGTTDDERCICSTKEKMKPLWIDDLLWDFLKMQDNKTEPVSLRAIGAFAVSGSEIYHDFQELQNWEINELNVYVDNYLKHFYHTIQTVKSDKFYENISYSSYHEDLRIALSYVYQKKYKEALCYLEDKGNGIFCNGTIWIHDEIRKYCEEQMRLSSKIH